MTTDRFDIAIDRGTAAIDALTGDWDELARRANAGPHLGAAWNAAIAAIGGSEPVIITARRDGALAALAALDVRSGIARTITPLGDHHPSYVGILAESADAAHAIGHAAREIGDVFQAMNISSQDDMTRAFADAFSGSATHRVFRAPCCWMPLEATLDAYLQRAQSGKTRKKTRQYDRNLHRAGTVEIERFSGPAIDDALMARIADVQADSWLERRGAAVFQQDRWRRFVITLGEAERARVWMMKHDGHDVAFAIASEFGCHMVYEWIAFRESHAHLRVGKLLTMRVIEDACTDGFASFDFSHGDAEYKRFWATNAHGVWRLAAGHGMIGSTVAAATAQAWQLARKPAVRRIARRVRTLLPQRRAA